MTHISDDLNARPDLGSIVAASGSTDELDRTGELVRVTLRRGWYAEAMKAISDQDRDNDLLADLLVEVADAFLEADAR